MLPKGPRFLFELDKINSDLLVLKTDVKPLIHFPFWVFLSKKLKKLAVVYNPGNLPWRSNRGLGFLFNLWECFKDSGGISWLT